MNVKHWSACLVGILVVFGMMLYADPPPDFTGTVADVADSIVDPLTYHKSNPKDVRLIRRQGDLRFIAPVTGGFTRISQRLNLETVMAYCYHRFGTPAIPGWEESEHNRNGRLDPRILKGLIEDLYPRGRWFGSYEARQLYRIYQGFARQFAVMAIHLHHNPELWNRVRRLQMQALQRKAEASPTILILYPGEYQKIRLPKCATIQDENQCRLVNMQIALFLARRKLDGTLPIVFAAGQRAYRDFDGAFLTANAAELRTATALQGGL